MWCPTVLPYNCVILRSDQSCIHCWIQPAQLSFSHVSHPDRVVNLTMINLQFGMYADALREDQIDGLEPCYALILYRKFDCMKKTWLMCFTQIFWKTSKPNGDCCGESWPSRGKHSSAHLLSDLDPYKVYTRMYKLDSTILTTCCGQPYEIILITIYCSLEHCF